MTPGRKGWVIFFSTLLGLAIIPLIFGIIMSRMILNPEYYRSFLDEQKFYEKVTPVLIDTTVGAVEGLTPDLVERFFVGELDKQQIDSIIISVLPEGWIKAQVDRFLDNVLNYVKFSTSSINFGLDLVPIKENLTGEMGRVTLEKIKGVFPECNLDFVKSLVNDWFRGENRTSILCNPPEKMYALTEPFLLMSLTKLSDSIPSQIQIWTFPSEGSDELSAQNFLRTFRFIHFSYQVLPWIYVCLVLVVVLLAYPSKRILFSGLGMPLIAGCLLSEIGIFTFYQAGEMSLSLSIYGQKAPEFLRDFLKLIFETGNSFLTQVSTTALLISLLFGGVGILLLLIGHKLSE